MGSIAIPSTGTIYVDTDCIIYSIETHPLYWSLLRPIWEAVGRKQITLMTSELALMETLVGPLKQKNQRLVAAYEMLFKSSDLKVVPVEHFVLRKAAELRAEIPGLRSPDALHAASAMVNGCSMFLTNDYGFRRLPNLPATILEEVRNSP